MDMNPQLTDVRQRVPPSEKRNVCSFGSTWCFKASRPCGCSEGSASFWVTNAVSNLEVFIDVIENVASQARPNWGRGHVGSCGKYMSGQQVQSALFYSPPGGEHRRQFGLPSSDCPQGSNVCGRICYDEWLLSYGRSKQQTQATGNG